MPRRWSGLRVRCHVDAEEGGAGLSAPWALLGSPEPAIGIDGLLLSTLLRHAVSASVSTAVPRLAPGVKQAATRGGLIATIRCALVLAARRTPAGPATVSVSSIAAATDHHLRHAVRTDEQPLADDLLTATGIASRHGQQLYTGEMPRGPPRYARDDAGPSFST